jgi:hypothetical protein
MLFYRQQDTARSTVTVRSGYSLRLPDIERDSSGLPTFNFMWKCEKSGARSTSDSGKHEVPFRVLTEFQGADCVSGQNRLQILSQLLNYYKFTV